MCSTKPWFSKRPPAVSTGWYTRPRANPSGSPEARLRISRPFEYRRRHESESWSEVARPRVPCSRAAACCSMSRARAGSTVAFVAGAPNGMTGIVCSSLRAGAEPAETVKGRAAAPRAGRCASAAQHSRRGAAAGPKDHSCCATSSTLASAARRRSTPPGERPVAGGAASAGPHIDRAGGPRVTRIGRQPCTGDSIGGARRAGRARGGRMNAAPCAVMARSRVKVHDD